MPVTYDFQCKDCLKLFDEVRNYDELHKVRCPKCKSRNIRKLINPTAVIFKGDGFTKSNSEN